VRNSIASGVALQRGHRLGRDAVTPAWRAAELGAANGHANARSGEYKISESPAGTWN